MFHEQPAAGHLANTFGQLVPVHVRMGGSITFWPSGVNSSFITCLRSAFSRSVELVTCVDNWLNNAIRFAFSAANSVVMWLSTLVRRSIHSRDLRAQIAELSRDLAVHRAQSVINRDRVVKGRVDLRGVHIAILFGAIGEKPHRYSSTNRERKLPEPNKLRQTGPE